MGKILAYYVMPHPPIVVPEVGKGQQLVIENTSKACDEVANEILKLNPDTIIIITPHGPLFRDAISLSTDNKITGDLSDFGAGKVKFSSEINVPLTQQIIKNAEDNNIPTVEITKDISKEYGIDFKLDHGTMVHLYFINKRFNHYKLVHITYGLLTKLQLYRFGMCIKESIESNDVNAVIIASGDLSHRLTKDGPYEYSEYGPKFDKEVLSLLQEGDVNSIFNIDPVLINNAGECALRSLYIMLGAMDGLDFKGNLLSYEGTFGVGYAIMSFSTAPKNRDTYSELMTTIEKKYNNKMHSEDPYIRLAKDSLTHYLIHGDYMEIPSYVTEEMRIDRRGLFVSIKKNGQLRGCIGTIFPCTDSIADEIIRNAIEAGINDPRFNPVQEGELPELCFSVDVLTEPEKAEVEELDPKKLGVIVRKGYKSGLLLPDLDGVDTVQKQINIALQKAGISPDEDFTIEKFEVVRHS